MVRHNFHTMNHRELKTKKNKKQTKNILNGLFHAPLKQIFYRLK